MITPDDNGYARVKRWREKNRVYVNLKQKEYRRRKKGGVESSSELATEIPHGKGQVPAGKSSPSSPTIEALRALISEPITEPVADSRKPVVYRNDYGNVITAEQWEKLQEKKREAKEKGYVLDEYSQ